MTPAESVTILRQFNEWRRDFDDKVEQPDTREISEAIDAAVEMIERVEKMESALEAVLNSGLLSRQYTIHDKMAALVRGALE